MRGKDIQRFVESEINATVKRVALTKGQIQAYDLPPQPSKKKDTMARGWIETHGDVAWELDALPPDVLVEIIEDAIAENIDKSILARRNLAVEERRSEIKRMIGEYFGDSND